MKLKLVTLIAAMALALSACDDHPDPDDQRMVDNEVQTPLQKTYDSIDDCKKEFTTDGDCTTQTVVINGSPQVMFYSPLFYPWGGIYHPLLGWGYGYPVPIASSRVITSRLPPTVSKPNFSNASSYASSRTSSLSAARSSATASRGGFGGTARGASSSSGSSSGGG